MLTIEEIQKKAIAFTRNTLDNEDSDQMCFTICLPLSIHLINNGIKNSIKCGAVIKESEFLKGGSHYWISLDGFVIDPTARQFKPTLDYVHFGAPLATERNFNFQNIYEEWSVPLINGWSNEKGRPPHEWKSLRTGMGRALPL
jgi:hypothetical protein